MDPTGYNHTLYIIYTYIYKPKGPTLPPIIMEVKNDPIVKESFVLGEPISSFHDYGKSKSYYIVNIINYPPRGPKYMCKYIYIYLYKYKSKTTIYTVYTYTHRHFPPFRCLSQPLQVFLLWRMPLVNLTAAVTADDGLILVGVTHRSLRNHHELMSVMRSLLLHRENVGTLGRVP